MELPLKSQRKIVKLLPLLGFCLLLNLLVIHAPPRIFSNPQTPALFDAQIQASSAAKPQQLSPTDWRYVSLPDDWYRRGATANQYWYRLQLKLDPQVDEIWALYLPMVVHNAEIYLNGIWAGQAGEFNTPVSRHHNEPLLFSFSSVMLNKGGNIIDIRVKAANPRQGFLSQAYIAPKPLLKPYWSLKYFVRVQFIEWVMVVMFVFSAVVLMFWVARPQDWVYGIFALELFLWGVHNLNLVVNEIPVSSRLWEAMTMSTLGWTVITMIFFNHRFVGGGWRTMERICQLIAVLGFGILFLPDIDSILSLGYGFWDIFLIIIGSYALIHLLSAYWQHEESDIYLMMLAGIPILVFGLHDILVVNHLLDRQQGLIIQYSAIPAVLLFSWFMLRRFLRSINQAENLAATLEQRVADNHRQIHQQYEQLKELEHQKLLADERERIMRDMHDGVGGQLVSVLNLLQKQTGEVFRHAANRVNRSLVDLHFVIDSLDPEQSDLPTLLGTMRMRLSEQIESAGIKLEWAVTDLPEVEDMTPTRCLHIMRIVQEAITNTIKHSGSDRLRIATGEIDGASIFIDVIDFGRGFNDVQQRGHGLDNMNQRAQMLGAELLLDTSPAGTRIRLLIPLVSSDQDNETSIRVEPE